MRRVIACLVICFSVYSFFAIAEEALPVHVMRYNTIEIPVTPFSNMESGYQATNPGFRFIIKDDKGSFVAGGPLTMDAVMAGYSDDATRGSAYGRLVLKPTITDFDPTRDIDMLAGDFQGTLSICMADDADSEISKTRCKNLETRRRNARPFQYLDKRISYHVENGNFKITRFLGTVGEGGSPEQIALSVFHPAYGFAAPGKAFKDYQSPLVLDLNRNNRLDLVNVWDRTPIVRFDPNGSGMKVRTGWVHSEDGFLFFDNGTGCVQDGTQLFGEYTDSKNGKKKFENGFKALAAKFDKKGVGRVVTKEHPTLKIWKDINQDGTCQKSEVFAASQFVKSILTTYRTMPEGNLSEDNDIRMTSTYLAVNGRRYQVGDVWFKQRRTELTKNTFQPILK